MSFPQTFLPDLLDFLSFRTFCVERKRLKSFRTMFGEYGRWSRKDQPTFNILSSVILVQCSFALLSRSRKFLLLMSRCVLLEYFSVYAAAVESIMLLGMSYNSLKTCNK